MTRIFYIFCLFSAAAASFTTTATAQDIRVDGAPMHAAMLNEIKGEVAPDSSADTLFEARRQARRAAERARAFLNSRGYYAPEVSFSVDPGPPAIPAIRVDPGRQFRIGSVEVSFDRQELPTDVRNAIDRVTTLKTGDVAVPEAILGQEAAWLAALKAQGFADARVLPRAARGDRDTATLDVEFRFSPGPRVVLGEVRYEDDPRIRDDYLERLVPFEQGALYTPDRLASFNQRLAQTRMFSRSAARLSESEPHVEAGVERRDVLVRLTPRPRYTLLAGASFSTAEGAGLTGQLTRRNLTHRGDTATARLTLAQQQRTGGAEWRVPNVFAYDHTVSFTAELTEEDTDAFDREALTTAANYEIRHSPALTTSFGASTEFTREIDAFGQRDVQILSASAAARLDQSNDPLDPSRGWRADIRVEPATVSGDSSANFVKVNSQLSAYQPVSGSGRFVLAARARAGAVLGAAIQDIPVSRRFFAGGGGSARGFEFQSIGPRNVDGQPTGGRALFETSAELRYRPDKGIGGVVFVDSATVSRNRTVNFDNLRSSAGVGLRYATPIGPIGVDIAAPIDKEPGDDPFQIYVSIGQAF